MQAAVEAATLLIASAIRDSRRPVENLGGALERMYRSANREWSRDLAVCIESVQFHDRLMQQLSFIHDLLGAILKQEPGRGQAYSTPRWEQLMQAIHGRASAASQTDSFESLGSTQVHLTGGTCELFE